MSTITFKKEKLVAEDVEWGMGEAIQGRGVLNQVNSSYIPYTYTQTVEQRLDESVSDTDLEAGLALKADLAGDAAQPFKVAIATTDEQSVPKAQMDTELALKADQTEVDLKADKTNVLELDNTTPFSPTNDTQPATKKYVDDKIIDIGAGDMRKSDYDKSGSLIVDTTEGIGVPGHEIGVSSYTQVMRLAQAPAVDLNDPVRGFHISVGTDVANAPTPGYINIEQMDFGVEIAQRVYSVVDRSWFYREAASGQLGALSFTPWERLNHQSDIQNDLLGDSTLIYKVLHAEQGKVLDDKITAETSRATAAEDANALAIQANTDAIDNLPTNSDTFIGMISMYNGLVASIPANWHLCDGTNGTPDMTNSFVMGTNTEAEIGTIQGSNDAVSIAHGHTATFTGAAMAAHGHTINTFYPSGAATLIGYGTEGYSKGNIISSSVSAGTPTGTIAVVNSGVVGTGLNIPLSVKLAYIQRIS